MTKREAQSHIANSNGDLMFLTDDIEEEEKQKVRMFIDISNRMVKEYFGVRGQVFDIVICHGRWEMEVQISSRLRGELSTLQDYYDITKSIAITDNHLQEIVLRYDVAKFGHYLHELIHLVIHKDHTHQMREGLAWYFTLKLLEPYRYAMPGYPSWVNELYVSRIKKMAHILGVDFLKDFAVGKAAILEESFPADVQELFLPEEVFYAKKRRFIK
jgi:hypothetical protein